MQHAWNFMIATTRVCIMGYLRFFQFVNKKTDSALKIPTFDKIFLLS